MKLCITAATTRIATRATWLTAWFLIQLPSLAADKSGVGPNVISVPSGPGSIEGLGESFQPTLNTGTAKYAITVKLPPGTAGHAPQLALSYEGGAGNGPLGLGWRLDIPHIQRQTDEGIPTYFDQPNYSPPIPGLNRPDVFINETKEELVPVGDGFHFCKNEGAFIRYRRIADHWEATRPDGTKLVFGRTLTARIANGSSGLNFCWLLESETDTHGNTIVYTYTNFAGANDANQKYFSQISYGPGAPPWNNFHFARFEYEPRSDWFEDCRPGFIVRTGRRLKSIVVGTQGPLLAGHLRGDFNQDGSADNLNRRYELGYVAYAGTNSHWSLLGSIRLIGADGQTALPPATFGYSICHPADTLPAAGRVIGAINEPPLVMDNAQVDLIDLNADALPDILRTSFGGGPHQVYLNDGPTNAASGPAIRWRTPVEVGGDQLAWNINLQASADIAHLADMDGDGLADLVYKSAASDVYYFANRLLSWGPRQLMTVLDFAPPSPFGNGDVKTADIDFDKRMDVIQSISTGNAADYRIWFNLGDRRYSTSVTVPQEVGFMFSQSGVQIVDFNGDRVPDIARVRPATIEVAAGLGYGRFATQVTVPITDLVLDTDEVSKAKLTDITGDGLVDLVIERAAPGVLWYWINLGNYSLSSRKQITGLPTGIGINAAIRWADLNGNGTTDLIYADQESSPRIRSVDVGELLNCGLAPNMLTAISNGIGRVTLIGYEPSTKFALADAAVGRQWPDPMPISVSVVAAVTNLDSLGHTYVTRFQYHNGYYDPVEKQFRGFAQVEQVDIGDETAPTLVTGSRFDTGRQYEAMKGKLLRATAQQEDARIFWDQTTTWITPPRVVRIGTNGETVQFAHPTNETKVIMELGQGTERRLEFEFAYDNFGNQTTNANYGVIENGNRSAFDDERIVTTQFIINTNAWLIRLPARLEIGDELGTVVSRDEMFYDDETFSAANFGSATVGNLTLKRSWFDPANATAYVQSTRTKYDAYGNPVLLIDPLGIAPGGTADLTKGHARELGYDLPFRAYPVREIIHIGNGSESLTFQAQHDEGFGTVVRSTDFNAHSTDYRYDALARLHQVIRPGDSVNFPTSEYDYALGVVFVTNGVVNFVETRQLDKVPGSVGTNRVAHYLISREFVDGLGRRLITKSEAEPAPGSAIPRVVVTEATIFTARQKPYQVLNPFYTTLSGASLNELLEFENIEAPSWRGSFHAHGQTVQLDLASAHKTATTYDATMRPVQVTNPDGTFARALYEPLLKRDFDENDVEPTSPYSNTPMVRYTDGLGRLVRVDEITRLNDDGTLSGDLRTWTTRYEYDLNDQLTKITDSQNNVKVFRCDGLKRKLFMNDPDRGVMDWKYDDASNLRESIDAKGQRITYSYDGANRRLIEDYHDEASQEFSYRRSPDVIYHYDIPFGLMDLGDGSSATAQNTKGNLAWVEDASGAEHNSYDARGRVAFTLKRVRDPIHDQLVNFTTYFRYDSLDRLVHLTYPDLDELTYEYTDRNTMRRIPGGPNGTVISNITYAPSGQMEKIEYGNGVQTRYEYDSRQRLARLLTHRPTDNAQLIHYTYKLDRSSNIGAIRDERSGADVQAADPRRNTQLFRYDDLYRLTRVQYSFNLPDATERNDGEINYRYDRIGNVLAQTSTIGQTEKGIPVVNLGEMQSGGSAGRFNRLGRSATDPPGPHALSQIRNSEFGIRNYQYDANGNMIEIDGLRCTWDFKDRLVRAENDEMIADYRYDYTGRRISKRITPKGQALNSFTVVYINPHFEIREHEQPAKYVWDADKRVARVTGSLNTTNRLQRIRLYPGWNLVSLAVRGAQFPGGFLTGKAFRWDAAMANWQPVAQTDALTNSAILWLSALTNLSLVVKGAYAQPSSPTLSAGASFLPSASLASWDLSPLFNSRPDLLAWRYDPQRQKWSLRTMQPSLLTAADSSLSAVLPAGQAIFLRADSSVQLQLPDPDIHYYHDDHVGSATCTSDAAGRSRQIAYFPYGHPRHEQTGPTVLNDYGFIRKERDLETGLTYFEARYLMAAFGRFNRVDPLASELSERFTAHPQRLNFYSYARNNPLHYADASGLADQVVETLGGEPAFKNLLGRMSRDQVYGREEDKRVLEHLKNQTIPLLKKHAARGGQELLEAMEVVEMLDLDPKQFATEQEKMEGIAQEHVRKHDELEESFREFFGEGFGGEKETPKARVERETDKMTEAIQRQIEQRHRPPRTDAPRSKPTTPAKPAKPTKPTRRWLGPQVAPDFPVS